MPKIAAIDVGLKRIGVAITLDKKIVFPKDAIMRKNRNQAARDVREFLREWEIETLVVGLPKGGSSEEEMERRIKHFVSLIEFKGDIEFEDEYGSSIEAEMMMRGVTKNRRDGKSDSLAAKIILERWISTKL